MDPIQRRLDGAWWMLRVGLGLGVFVAGLDKFFDLLATWSMYLSPLAERILPIPASAFMRGVGVMEMLLGIAILFRWTRAGAYVMATWLVAVAVNLAASGNFWDLALRDLEIALSAVALGRLTEWRASLSPAWRTTGKTKEARVPGGVGAHSPRAGAGQPVTRKEEVPWRASV